MRDRSQRSRPLAPTPAAGPRPWLAWLLAAALLLPLGVPHHAIDAWLAGPSVATTSTGQDQHLVALTACAAAPDLHVEAPLGQEHRHCAACPLRTPTAGGRGLAQSFGTALVAKDLVVAALARPLGVGGRRPETARGPPPAASVDEVDA